FSIELENPYFYPGFESYLLYLVTYLTWTVQGSMVSQCIMPFGLWGILPFSTILLLLKNVQLALAVFVTSRMPSAMYIFLNELMNFISISNVATTGVRISINSPNHI